MTEPVPTIPDDMPELADIVRDLNDLKWPAAMVLAAFAFGAACVLTTMLGRK